MSGDKPRSAKSGASKPAFSLPDFGIERELLREGYITIAGIDEAGRGSIAGPLSVGCAAYSGVFIENPPQDILLINDSKKLSHRKRLAAFNYIKARALFVMVQLVPHSVIDELNVNGATKFAIERLISEMPVAPDILLLDGSFSFDLTVPYMSIKSGDARSLSIASASIAAKVKRDEIMERMDAFYQGYGLAANKGYPTRAHIKAVFSDGPSPVHRKTYEPLKGILSGENRKS